MTGGDLARKTERARKRLLTLYHEADSGHVGGSLSCFEALMALHHELTAEDDRFILSKGHAAGALYVALWSKGLISEDTLRTFAGDGTLLPGHPSGNGIPGLLFPTGSLGHGPSLAAGLALAARFQGSARHIWCLCSDGEWQEGACWEALIFAVHHKLDNLTLLVDQNGLQAFGTTQDVVSISDLSPRFSAFGSFVTKLDGHDQQALIEAAKITHEGKPRVLVLQTRKGRGTRLEGQVACHYLPLNASEYDELMSDVGRDEA